MVYSTTLVPKLTLHIPAGGKKRDFDVAFKEDQLPQVPIITNTKDLKAGVVLKVLDDKGLGKIYEKLQQDIFGGRGVGGYTTRTAPIVFEYHSDHHCGIQIPQGPPLLYSSATQATCVVFE